MFPFRKILFPVDYSAPCLEVVPYVTEMVRRFSADLTLVHAYGVDFAAFSELPIQDSILAEAGTEEDRRLRKFAMETFPARHVECFAELGEAGSVIDKIVQHEGTDLVMLATHGRGPIRRLLLGSVAAKVLHDVTAAVWTGTSSALKDHAPELAYKSVLCALDDSDEAEGVLKAAAAFASHFEAHLSLVQVVGLPPPTLDIDVSPYKKDLMDAAHFRIRELKGSLGIEAPHAVVDAPVTDGVCQEALRQKADLIITGRGRTQTTVRRIWSHLYDIVRESPCPVLSI